ncbi:hypothetical protein ACM5Q9_00185 [Advenella sp. RU8]|uniref:hypothetical protein n=1 Tax=Advenella sp. RU8 TaxID=3399575 RepID=UPI003AAD2A09
MSLTTTKTGQQLNKTTHSPKEQRFNRAWQQVINQQKENDEFRENVQIFIRETLDQIRDTEKACMEAMYDTCLHLLGFFSRKSMPQWQRETLMSWLTQYLRAMQDNPFSVHLDLAPITQGLNDALDAMYPHLSIQCESQPYEPEFHDGSMPESTHEDYFSENDPHDFFNEFEQTGAASHPGQEQDDADESESFFHHFFKQQQAFEQERLEQSQALKRLMKSSSVNKLFRKVAGILHPDKEKNEAARQEKNRLMSELIEARNTNDIPRIFAFYAEYVGQSPLQELGEDLDSATDLLERQYLDLLITKEDILHEEPLTADLYRQFQRKSPAATQRAIKKHLKETKAHAQTLQSLRRDITSLNKLKPYLEFRYETLMQSEVLDFI